MNTLTYHVPKVGVDAVRSSFELLYKDWETRPLDPDIPMLELLNVSFDADDDHIFGAPNPDYIARELEWYYSQSLSVFDIPGGPPKIWERVADSHGHINSNYGYLLFSEDNGHQYQNVIATLQKDPNSRQAIAVYTRPSVHDDAWHNGRSDFICTNTVQYFVREGLLYTKVDMRSNDAVFGYRNDYAWQVHVSKLVAQDLDVELGPMTWAVGSLHIYPRHYRLIKHFIETRVHDAAL